MNIWKAAAIGGVVFVGVKLYKDGKIPGLGTVGIPAPAGAGGTIPSPAGDEVGAPGGGGVVGSDPTVLPGQNSPEQSNGGCNPLNAKSCYPGGSTRKPIVRDHRTPGRAGPSTTPKPGPGKGGTPVVCVRAPCPTKPTSGGVSTHAHSVAIQRMGGRTPLVF